MIKKIKLENIYLYINNRLILITFYVEIYFNVYVFSTSGYKFDCNMKTFIIYTHQLL